MPSADLSLTAPGNHINMQIGGSDSLNLAVVTGGKSAALEADANQSPLTMSFDKYIKVIHGGVDYYHGRYDVTPSAHEAQTLETKNRYLTEDVNVKIIPTYETTNSTGTTFYIAGD